jgi:glutaredoxin
MTMDEAFELFMYRGCPFCERVLRWLEQAGIRMPLRDILADRAAFAELVEGGGRRTVPCLKISSQGRVRWLYESLDIIRYLEGRRAPAT